MDVQADLKSTKLQEEDKHLIMGMRSSSVEGAAGRKRRCLCVAMTSAVVLIVGVFLLFLILGLTVFKPKRPTTHVDSISLDDLEISLDMARLRARFNATLDMSISVKNPNRVGFTYTNSTAFLRYRGSDVGEVPVPGGRIGARQTLQLNLTLTLMADRLLSNTALYSDAFSGGMLGFQTYIRVAGKVRIVFNFGVVTYTTCDLQIDLANRSLSNQNCRYKTKI